MADPIPYDLDVGDIEDVDFGAFSQVGRVAKSSYVAKVPFSNAYEHIDRENHLRTPRSPSNIVRCFGGALYKVRR